MIRFTSVRDVYHTGMKPERQLGKSPQTYRSYEDTLNLLRDCFGQDPSIDMLDDQRVAHFLSWLVQIKKRSPATANKHLRQVRAIVNYAVKKGLLQESLDLRKLDEDDEDPLCWSIEEVSSILSNAVRIAGDIENVPAALFWECLILLLLDCGPRINAFMALRLTDVDLERRLIFIRPRSQRGTVEVRQKQRKGQTLPFHQQTADRLRVLIDFDPSRQMLFPWPFDLNIRQLSTLRKHYRKILKAAGLSSDRKSMFHRLRRTTGTYIALGSSDDAAAQHLGHSHKRVLIKSYKDPSKEHPDRARPRACDAIPRPKYSDDRQLPLFD
jgi:integrase